MLGYKVPPVVTTRSRPTAVHGRSNATTRKPRGKHTVSARATCACISLCSSEQEIANKTSPVPSSELATPSISSAVDGSFEYMTSAEVEQAFNQHKAEFMLPENCLLTNSCKHQSGQEIETPKASSSSEEAPSSSPAEYMSTAEFEEAFDQDKSEFVCAGKNYLWSAETYKRPDSPLQPFFWLAGPDQVSAAEVVASTGPMSSSRIENDGDDDILYASSVEEQEFDKDKSKVVPCVRV